MPNITRNTTEDANWTTESGIETVEDDVVDGFSCQLVEKLAGETFQMRIHYITRGPSSQSMTACPGLA